MKFHVSLTAVGWFETDVEARNEEEAAEIAYQEAEGLASVDWEVEDVEELTDEEE